MIYQKFKNLDEYFKETTGDKIMLNEIKYFSTDDRDMINRALVTVYDDNTISLIPSCDCGELKGGYLLGKHCVNCSTVVRDIQDKTDPLIWMRAMDDMPKFLSPHFWLMMRNVMAKKIDCMRWLSDTSYNPPDIPDFLIGIKNTLHNFERSYPYLVDHIEDIIVFLQNHSTFKSTARKTEILEGILDLYKKHKNVLYSQYLPMVNKKLFIMENTSKGKYTNLGIADIIDTTLQFIKTVNDERLTPNKKSNCMARTLSDLSSIYGYYNKEYLSRKTGIFRKHIYGARAHFTFRGVIVSIAGPHNYNEIHVPWSIGVTAFRPHLLNLLCKEGLRYKEASRRLFDAVNNYDPLIDKLLNRMIEESEGGIAVLLQRN